MAAYSLKEIDDMRDALAERQYRLHPYAVWSERVDRRLERQLRTYLQEGVSPEELYKAVEAMPANPQWPTDWKPPTTD